MNMGVGLVLTHCLQRSGGTGIRIDLEFSGTHIRQVLESILLRLCRGIGCCDAHERQTRKREFIHVCHSKSETDASQSIVAFDLAKYKSAACGLDSESGECRYEMFRTN
jgi:hypothetical protein